MNAPTPQRLTAKQQRLLDVRTNFETHTAQHLMTVLHDDGVYRHLQFADPATRIYNWSIVTWPGHLAVTGDAASGYVFARIHDMVDFFEPAAEPYRINFYYWAEKLLTAHHDATTEFNVEALIEILRRDIDGYTRRHSDEYATFTDNLFSWEPLWVETLTAALIADLHSALSFRPGPTVACEFLKNWEYGPARLAANLTCTAQGISTETSQRILRLNTFNLDENGDAAETIANARVPEWHLTTAMHAIVFGLEQYRAYKHEQRHPSGHAVISLPLIADKD